MRPMRPVDGDMPPRNRSGPKVVHWPWRWQGLLPIICGIALVIAGVRELKRTGTAVLPIMLLLWAKRSRRRRTAGLAA